MLAGLEWLAVKEGSAYREGMALGWRGVEVEMRMGNYFQGPETTAMFGSECDLAHHAAGGAFPAGLQGAAPPPPHPHPLCRAPQGAGP